ncbi:MAG: hypothetical protein MUE72_08345 [Chitinophagaceae bacterium]|nr:hypothetical protein [Chitinophagaceae bacterium]
MSTSAATPLSNEVFQENWSNLSESGSQTKDPAKISYLMVEKVTPPAYMWNKIAQQLDAEDNIEPIQQTTLSNKKITALMVLGAIAFITLALYVIL